MTLSANPANWSQSDYKSVTATQIAALTPAQIAAMAHPDWLNAAAFAGFSAAGVQAIAISWVWMSAAQINALSATAMAAIPVAGIAQMSTAALSGLDAAHIGAMTAGQVAALGVSQFKALGAAQFAGFGAVQVRALTSAQLAVITSAQISGLGAAGAAALSVTQLNAIGLAIRGLSTVAMGALSAATVDALSAAQIAELSGTQVSALSSAALTGLSAAKIAILSPGQLQALATRVQLFGAAQLAGLSTTNLLGIYTRLSSAQIAGLGSAAAAAVKSAQGATTSLLSAVTAGGLQNEIKVLVAGGQSLFSYQGLLTVLKGVDAAIGSSGLTQAQLTDLKALTKAVGTVLGTGGYLYGELNALVDGNALNATWTGGATSTTKLGNLAVGTSAAQFADLIGKWFLGTDLPSWSTTSTTTWSVKGGALFGLTGPQPAEVTQGGIGDCYLIAAILDVAQDQPSLIESMFTDNGNGTLGVRMYGYDGKPVYFTIDGEFPSGGRTAGTTDGTLWVSLLEKAFVSWRALEGSSAFTYDGIAGGWDEGLVAMTGKSTTDYISGWSKSQSAWDSTVKQAVITALNADEEVLYGSFINDKDAANGKTDLVSDHMFAVIGYDAKSGDFILRNPWGAAGGSSWNGVFEQSIDQLYGGTTGDTSNSGFVVAEGNSPAGAVNPAYAAAQMVQAIAAMPQSAGTLTTNVALSPMAQAQMNLAASHA